jgi:CxxC-x17-CxxC domain-containing protein
MSFEDKTLICVQCNKEFTFTAGEQEFYHEKGLQSEPKRCKNCRQARRKQKSRRRNDGIYRSPAFEDSAPRHQKIRGRQGGRFKSREYRSPGLKDPRDGQQEYRSPAFRDSEIIKPEQEYRSPGFREYADIDPKEEYRSPGFREYADIDLKGEYRSPGFQDLKTKYKDEKPMFSIVCTKCGEDAMIPILPDPDKDMYCQKCYKAKQEAAKNKPPLDENIQESTVNDMEAPVTDDVEVPVTD